MKNSKPSSDTPSPIKTSFASLTAFLVSCPEPRGIDRFYNEILKKKFENYRESLEKLGAHGPEIESELFCPKAYMIYGRFDLAILTLADDYTFATRMFKPHGKLHQPQDNGKQRAEFEVKSFIGASPNYGEGYGTKRRAFCNNLFQGHSHKPLLTICQIKISEVVNISYGHEAFEIACQKIDNIIRRIDSGLTWLCDGSYGYHDITLYILSDNYSVVFQIVDEIRKTELQQVLNDFSNLNWLTDDSVIKMSRNHLFDKTVTHFGIELNTALKLKQPDQYAQLLQTIDIDRDKNLSMSISMRIKPGHTPFIIEDIEKSFPGSTYGKVAGWEDLIIYETTKPTHWLDTACRLARFIQEEKIECNHHVLAIESKLICMENISPDNFDQSKHVFVHSRLLEKGIPTQTATDVRRSLKTVGLPFVELGKITNLYSGYMTTFTKSFAFSSHLELHEFLKEYLPEEAKLYYEKFKQGSFQFNRFRRRMMEFAEFLEKAYYNRLFQNSAINLRQSDLKVEHRGNFLRILSSFDSAYKLMCRDLGEFGHPYSFVSPSSDAGVYSTSFSIQLNYLHLIQPSLFICVFVHEASNYFIPKLFDFLELDKNSGSTKGKKNLFRLCQYCRLFSKRRIQPRPELLPIMDDYFTKSKIQRASTNG